MGTPYKPRDGDVFSVPSDPDVACCVCKKSYGQGARLQIKQMARQQYIVCADCHDDERKRRAEAALAARRKLPVSPEVLAKRLENLDRARKSRRERGMLIRQHVLTDGVQVSNKHHQILLMHLGGIENREIASALGYSTQNAVGCILRLPHIRAAIQKVEQARLERILSGDYGVQAQARAAAPNAMKRIMTEVDGAEKASDRLKAAEANLKIAGEWNDKKTVHHVHELVRGMDKTELQDFVTHRRWPVRLQGIVAKLGLPAPEKS